MQLSIYHGAKQFVDGDKHTNTIEGFWAQLKRAIFGIYHFVSAKYLQRYVDEAVFRYNSRVMDRQRPYVELVAGIHNIFKLIHVEYVHRMNYLRPGTQKWGIRFMFRVTF